LYFFFCAQQISSTNEDKNIKFWELLERREIWNVETSPHLQSYECKHPVTDCDLNHQTFARYDIFIKDSKVISFKSFYNPDKKSLVYKINRRELKCIQLFISFEVYLGQLNVYPDKYLHKQEE